MSRKGKSSPTSKHGPKRETFDPRGENSDFITEPGRMSRELMS